MSPMSILVTDPFLVKRPKNRKKKKKDMRAPFLKSWIHHWYLWLPMAVEQG